MGKQKQALLYSFLFLFLLVGGLIFAELNFLFFHTAIEVWAMLVAFSIFIVAWNTRKRAKTDYIFILGTGYLLIGILTFFHTFTYKGITIIVDAGANPPTQFWMAARFLEAFVFLLASLSISKNISRIKLIGINLFMAVYSLLAVLGILFIPFFPDAFIDGVGLTSFKIYGEYVVILVLLIAIINITKQKRILNQEIYRLFIYATAASVVAELFFTTYVDVYGLSNTLGHIFYFISFYLLYRVIVKKSLEQPQQIIYKRLKDMESDLSAINDCFLSFGSDNLANIKRIVTTTGELLEADSAFYNQVNQEYMFNIASWNAPQEIEGFSDRAEGHLCTYVTKQRSKRPIVLTNLQSSQFAETDPAVKMYNLKTYIGCGVWVNGEIVGTLCTLFTKDIDISGKILNIISTLAKALGVELERSLDKEQLTQELNRAREIQQSILEQDLAPIAGLDVVSNYHQAERVGGDYFELLRLDNRLITLMVDVTGHGLDAALITVFVNTFFRHEVKQKQEITDPITFLEHLTEDFKEQGFPANYSLEVFIGVLNLDTLEYNYAVAGAIRSFIISTTEQLELTQLANNSGMLINSTIPEIVFGSGSLTLQPGQQIIIYTDGIDESFLIEQYSSSQKWLEYVIKSGVKTDDLKGFVTGIIEQSLADYQTEKIKDDMTIIGVKNLLE